MRKIDSRQQEEASALALRATPLRRGSRDGVWCCGEIDCATAECLKEMGDVLVRVPRVTASAVSVAAQERAPLLVPILAGSDGDGGQRTSNCNRSFPSPPIRSWTVSPC